MVRFMEMNLSARITQDKNLLDEYICFLEWVYEALLD